MSWTALCNLRYGQVCCWQCVLSKWPSFEREKTNYSCPFPTPAAPAEVSSQVFWPITPKPGLEPTNLTHPHGLPEIQQLRTPLVTKDLQICTMRVRDLLGAKPTRGFARFSVEHPEAKLPGRLQPLRIAPPWVRDVAACCAMPNMLCTSELCSQRPMCWGKCCQGLPIQSASEGGETPVLHLPACWVSHLAPQWLPLRV